MVFVGEYFFFDEELKNHEENNAKISEKSTRN